MAVTNDVDLVTQPELEINMQIAIPYMQIRGGSSKGVFFNVKDLPTNEEKRDKVILAAMEGVGIGDPRQVDGLGGADSLTAKVGIISPPTKKAAHLDYLFMQVVIGEGRLSTSQNCGNILSGVLPYAIESGLITATHPTTTATIHMLNSGGLCEVTVQTPNGELAFTGDTKVDGVLGTGASITCNYLDIAGADCGALLPTGKVIDIIDGIEVSCVDNGMPVVNIRATDLGISGYEPKAELDADEDLKKDIESIRIQAGRLMNLGDVSQKTVPKMSLISPPKNGGLVNTRTFIPHVCHPAIGVLGAVSAATGCLIPGSVAEGIVNIPADFSTLSVEHPLGQFSVSLEAHFQGEELVISKSGTVRTARIISKGEVYIPHLS